MGSFFQCTSCSLGRFTNFSLHGPPTSYPNITKKYPNCTLKRNELFRLPRLHLTRQICCSALVNFFKCFSRIVSEGLQRNKWVIQISIRPFTRFQVAPTKFIWPEQPKLILFFLQVLPHHLGHNLKDEVTLTISARGQKAKPTKPRKEIK